MRILMANTFHHRRGGDATYALSVSELLRQHGHDVVPLAMRHPENDPSPWERWFVPWVDFRDLRGWREQVGAAATFAYNRDAARSMRAILGRHRPDVVHVQHIHHHLTPSIFGPVRALGIPVVWTVHDYELLCPNGLLFVHGAPCEACKGHRYHNAVVRSCKRNGRLASALAASEKALHAAMRLWQAADRFLCPSRFLADKLVSFGVPRERVFHQPNFVDTPSDAPTTPGRGVLYAGRLAEEKGIRVLLDAARRLPHLPFTLCGTGPLEAWVRDEARTLPHVRVTGHLPRVTLARHIATAAVVVVPSLWWENFPYAVIEAQAAGRAVVATRTGGIPEQIDNGIDGVLVAPNDADALATTLDRVAHDPQLTERLGRAGWDRVRIRLDPQRHYDALLAHYAAVGAR